MKRYSDHYGTPREVVIGQYVGWAFMAIAPIVLLVLFVTQGG